MIVVTGASGFLGRATVAHLRDLGLAVTAAARRPLPPQPGLSVAQVASYAELAPSDEDAVLIHLAENRDLAVAEAMGPDYIAQARAALSPLLARNWRHVVYASSAVVYGDEAAHPRLPDEAVSPGGVYGRAKLACEEMVLAAGGGVARLANLYGPGMAANAVLGDILKQIPGSGPLLVRDAAPVRDFLWVEDAAAGLAALAAGRVAGIYNFGGGEAVSVAELARRLLNAAGEGARPVAATAPGSRSSHLALDISRNFDDLGWQPKMPLDRGLATLLKLAP